MKLSDQHVTRYMWHYKSHVQWVEDGYRWLEPTLSVLWEAERDDRVYRITGHEGILLASKEEVKSYFSINTDVVYKRFPNAFASE